MENVVNEDTAFAGTVKLLVPLASEPPKLLIDADEGDDSPDPDAELSAPPPQPLKSNGMTVAMHNKSIAVSLLRLINIRLLLYQVETE